MLTLEVQADVGPGLTHQALQSREATRLAQQAVTDIKGRHKQLSKAGDDRTHVVAFESVRSAWVRARLKSPGDHAPGGLGGR